MNTSGSDDLVGTSKSASWLDGITLNGTLDMSQSNDDATYILNRLTLNGTIYLGGDYSYLYLGNSGDTPGGIPITTTSAGTIQFGGSDNYIYGLDYGGYSLGPGITVVGDGSYNEIDAYYGPMVNDGVIEDNTSGGTLTINGTWTNTARSA